MLKALLENDVGKLEKQIVALECVLSGELTEKDRMIFEQTLEAYKQHRETLRGTICTQNVAVVISTGM